MPQQEAIAWFSRVWQAKNLTRFFVFPSLKQRSQSRKSEIPFDLENSSENKFFGVEWNWKSNWNRIWIAAKISRFLAQNSEFPSRFPSRDCLISCCCLKRCTTQFLWIILEIFHFSFQFQIFFNEFLEVGRKSIFNPFSPFSKNFLSTYPGAYIFNHNLHNP